MRNIRSEMNFDKARIAEYKLPRPMSEVTINSPAVNATYRDNMIVNICVDKPSVVSFVAGKNRRETDFVIARLNQLFTNFATGQLR